MTASPDAPVSDERLEEMVASVQAHLDACVASDPERACRSTGTLAAMASALRELQRLRAGRVPVEPIELERDYGDD